MGIENSFFLNRLETWSQIEDQRRLVNQLTAHMVSSFRFDVLPLYVNLLKSAEKQPLFAVYEAWKPEPEADLYRNGGSDCFGLAAALSQQLTRHNLKAEIIPFTAEGLLAQKSFDELLDGVGTVGVAVKYSDGSTGLVEPGFSTPKQLLLVNQPFTSLEVGGRHFSAYLDHKSQTGRFSVSSSDYPLKKLGFTLSSVPRDHLSQLQKNYLRLRTTIHCDRLDLNGNKITSIKINLLKENIKILHPHVSQKLRFSEWPDYDSSKLAGWLGLDAKIFQENVSLIIQNADRIRSLWTQELQQLYYQDHSLHLEHRVRTWKEARLEGFSGGGVVALITNGGDLLIYPVPKSREKPKIGRLAGQLNTMVETASGDEDPVANLYRGLSEELALSPERVKIRSYRETHYGQPNPDGSKILARCFVVELDDHFDLKNLKFTDGKEGGVWQRIPISKLDQYQIEPNLKPILISHLKEGLL